MTDVVYIVLYERIGEPGYVISAHSSIEGAEAVAGSSARMAGYVSLHSERIDGDLVITSRPIPSAQWRVIRREVHP